MPWCDRCDQIVEDEELAEDCLCPTCGTTLVEPQRRPIPWTFRFMLVAFVGYLGYRIYQGLTWVAHHL